MKVLAIETSCDETAAAVYDGKNLFSNVIFTQEIHKKYGGVVPELASREHLRQIVPVVNEALDAAGIEFNAIEGICVTKGPGLIGSLLIGVSYAKSLALSLDIPIIGVNHIEAHLWAPALENKELKPPFLGLIISGGHTQLWCVWDFGKYELLGQTLDDAVGEAFDKTASLLNLAYPGGPEIDRLSTSGDPEFVKFPRPKMKSGDFNFSFSGLKTSVLYYLRDLSENEIKKHTPDIAASFQLAVVETLVHKTFRAAEYKDLNRIVLGGGVSANRGLKSYISEKSEKNGYEVILPPLSLSTDNAAMIAYTGRRRMIENGERDAYDFPAVPGLKLV